MLLNKSLTKIGRSNFHSWHEALTKELTVTSSKLACVLSGDIEDVKERALQNELGEEWRELKIRETELKLKLAEQPGDAPQGVKRASKAVRKPALSSSSSSSSSSPASGKARMDLSDDSAASSSSRPTTRSHVKTARGREADDTDASAADAPASSRPNKRSRRGK